MRTLVAVAGALFILAAPGNAEDGWVINRGENTIAWFDQSTGTQNTGSPLIVGLQPVDLADVTLTKSGTTYKKIYVADYSGNSVSVIDRSKASVVKTYTESPVYGTFSQPTALTYANAPTRGLTQTISVNPTVAVVDRKGLAEYGGTLRFIDPVTEAVVDEWEIGIAGFDPTGVACAPTNGVFWITGKGTDEVVRLSFPAAGPPFASTPKPSLTQIAHATIADPVKVVVADDDNSDGDPDYLFVINAGSNSVTVLNNYGVVQGSVDLGASQIDALLLNDKLYVVTANDEIKVIPVASPFAVSDTIAGFGGDLGRIGKSSGGVLYIGSGAGGGSFSKVDLSTTPATITALTFSQQQPYAFVFTETTAATSSANDTLVNDSDGDGGGGCFIDASCPTDGIDPSALLAGLAFLILFGYTATRLRILTNT